MHIQLLGKEYLLQGRFHLLCAGVWVQNGDLLNFYQVNVHLDLRLPRYLKNVCVRLFSTLYNLHYKSVGC